MLLLAYRNLQRRPARTFLTALAIALGVAMIFASQIVAVAVEQAEGEARRSRLAGADLEVRSAMGAVLDEALAAQLAARPEVGLTAPYYQQPEGGSTGLALLGVDPARQMGYELLSGDFFSDPEADEVLLPALWAAQRAIRVGSEVRLVMGEQHQRYRVVGLLKPDSETLISQPTAWLPLATMQRAFDTPGAATFILVRLEGSALPEPTRETLQAALGTPYLVTSRSGGSGARSFLTTTAQVALPFASLAVLLTGSFLVYNAFAITLAERRREIGQLRTLGMTPQQVVTLTLLEALGIALLASGLGLLLGGGLARAMIVFLVERIQGKEAASLSLPPGGMLLALGAGVLVTLGVTLQLARQAGRVSPLAALGLGGDERGGESWHLRPSLGGALLLVLLFAGGIGVMARQMERGNSDLVVGLVYTLPFLLAGASLCLLPSGVWAACQFLAWLAARLPGQAGGVARLAVGSMTRQPGRALLTTATITLGLMLLVTLSGLIQVTNASTKRALISLFDGDFLLARPFTVAGRGDFAQIATLPLFPPLPRPLREALGTLRAEAEVLSVANLHLPGYSQGAGVDNGFALDLALMRDNPNFVVTQGSWAEAAPHFASGPALTLPEVAARRHDLHPGDTVELETLKGRVPFRVALVGGSVPMMTSEVGERYFHAYPFFFLINAQPGGDKAQLEAHLKEIAQTHALFFAEEPQRAFSETFEGLTATIQALFTGLTSLSTLVAALGIVVTLVASVLERQREIGTLRALGMSRGQVRGLLLVEAGLLGLTGALLAVVGGLFVSFAFGWLVVDFQTRTGIGRFDAPLPWAVAVLALLLGPTISMLAALYPAARAASVVPAEAMRAEGAR